MFLLDALLFLIFWIDQNFVLHHFVHKLKHTTN